MSGKRNDRDPLVVQSKRFIIGTSAANLSIRYVGGNLCIKRPLYNANADVTGNGVLTWAMMANGVVYCTGTALLTTSTGAEILTAMGGDCEVGDSYDFSIIVKDDAEDVTVAAGASGVTIVNGYLGLVVNHGIADACKGGSMWRLQCTAIDATPEFTLIRLA